jgi:enterochelin esterase-like enzyme
MPRHAFAPSRALVREITIESRHLQGNLLGDPTSRRVAVVLPHDYETHTRRLPVLVYLDGFTGSGLRALAWAGFGESLPQRIDRLVDRGEMGECILVLPDAFTALGGNQYIDSIAIGRWGSYLAEELVPAIDAQFRTIPDAAHRGIFGKSSGGYGALMQAIRHPGTWGAVAVHAGDCGFEWVYQPHFPGALTMLASFGGSVQAFVEHFERTPKVKGSELEVLMTLAMGATYDPDPAAYRGIRLPVDPYTCTLLSERWEAWLAHDPVRLVQQRSTLDALGSLRGLFIDVGSRDQYNIQFGSRALHQTLDAAGVPHVYEEFPDDHSSTQYRYDRSLPWLFATLSGG